VSTKPGAEHHLSQHPLDLSEIRNLRPDVLQMVNGDPLHLGTGIAASVHKLQQRADLVEREAELASPADEAEAPGLSLGVEPMASSAARRERHQPDPLVVPDRLDVAAGSLRQGPDPPLAR
jgi:hypothetical protein